MFLGNVFLGVNVGGIIEFLVVAYIVACAGVGLFAMFRKKRFSDWMLISLFATPFLGFGLVALIDKLKK